MGDENTGKLNVRFMIKNKATRKGRNYFPKSGCFVSAVVISLLGIIILAILIFLYIQYKA